MFVYVFETYIRFGVRALFTEHYSSALFIGAWRVECAMFGLFEPSLVPWLFGCFCLVVSMHACVVSQEILAKAFGLSLVE